MFLMLDTIQFNITDTINRLKNQFVYNFNLFGLLKIKNLMKIIFSPPLQYSFIFC